MRRALCARDHARRVVRMALVMGRSYAVFVKQQAVSVFPVDGVRFKDFQQDPEAMERCIGVFDESATIQGVTAELLAAGVEAEA